MNLTNVGIPWDVYEDEIEIESNMWVYLTEEDLQAMLKALKEEKTIPNNDK